MEGQRSSGNRVGLVMTMGSLHGGHLSLIRRASAECDFVTVTVYVNPLQFGPGEDLSDYPESLPEDLELAAGAGANLVFAPVADSLWPEPPATSVLVEGISHRLEGLARPGHLEGVATIVSKMISLAGGCLSYFGEKDYQQLTLIRRLVQDLSLPTEVVGCPTVRETDGLALSSRNAYLDPEQRRRAPALYSALLEGRRRVEDDGATDPSDVVNTMQVALDREPAFSLSYAAVVEPASLVAPDRLDGEVRLLMAASIGNTRLIDNLPATAQVAAASAGTIH